jgi:hypothetical protein
MKAARIALLSLVCLVPLAASAQWSWIDRDGRRVFSDQAPPADVPASQILKRPGARAAAAAAAPQAAAPVGVDPALKPAGRDKALEEKRKQAEAAEADKKKQHEAELTAARADNCSRARTSKATLDSGQRIAMVNPQGEKEFMSDEQRAAETKRLEQVIARDCPASDRQ